MNDRTSQPLLYTELAEWWPLLSHPDEYVEEASTYARMFSEASPEKPRSLLELGSGGGNNASHLKKNFEMTLVELSPDMLAVSRRLNPECEHVQGDMRSVRLNRKFDGVFAHDAIAYMTTTEDLRAVFETATAHLQEGGIALFCPDHLRDTFTESTDRGGNNDGKRGLRYLEWTWDPDPEDSHHLVDYAYLLRETDGSVRALHDRHVCGLFAEAEWLSSLEAAGFDPHPVSISFEDEDRDWVVFVARRVGEAQPS
jgi:trans-aconitate methyltransferase